MLSLGGAFGISWTSIPLGGVQFFAPDVAFQDAEKYLPSLLEKHGKLASDVLSALQYLQQIIDITDRDLYAAFEHDARERLRGRDEDDWPGAGLSARVKLSDLE